MKYCSKWIQFIKERFSPIIYSIMIFSFLGAHFVIYQKIILQTITFNIVNIFYYIPLVLAVILFFFKLRLFDEVKDLKFDRIYHPDRPLPRGLLNKQDVLRVVFIIIFLELICFSLYGFWSLASMILTALYTVLMYKEFFSKQWLRMHLTTYAVTHTLVVVFISISIFIALANSSFASISPSLINFSLVGWFLFNIFEFSRKTYAYKEEKEGVNSYSKIFGRWGAVLLVVIMFILSIFFIKQTIFFVNSIFFLFWLLIIIIFGLLYIIYNQPRLAKNYRIVGSLSILFVYLTIIFFL